MDRGAWRTTVHGVTKSQIRLSTQIAHIYLEYTAQQGELLTEKETKVQGL